MLELPPQLEEELKKFNFTPIKNEKIKKIITKKYMFYTKEVFYIHEDKQHSISTTTKFLKKDETKLENTPLTDLMPEIRKLPELEPYSDKEQVAIGLIAYLKILTEISK